jgi:uncharacterized membrane protein YhaH (DUF805 family)
LIATFLLVAGSRDCRFSLAAFIYRFRLGCFYLITIALFSSRTSPGYWVGLVMVGACLMLLCVCAVSLVVRRLHDLRLSGYHVIWVAAVPEVISTVLSYGPAKEVLVELPPAAVSLWLLLWPGNKMSNRFGEVPQ